MAIHPVTAIRPAGRRGGPAPRFGGPARSTVPADGAERARTERLAAIGGGVEKIAHDLRNLLAVAGLHLESLAGNDDPSVRRTVDRLAAALARAEDYAALMLAYGRGQEAAPRRPIALRPLVEEAGRLFGLGAGGPVRLTVEVAPDLVVPGDRTALYRAIGNLLGNAVEALRSHPGERRITVSAGRLGAGVRILVSDTGPGVPDHLRGSLFEPFRSGRPGGSGLGLAVVRDVAAAHGGSVRLVPGSPGATFALDLPAPVLLRAGPIAA